MPSARGIESVISCTTRCAQSAEPRAGTTTTSRSAGSTAGSWPPRTAVASRAIAPPASCRYRVCNSTTGTAAEPIRSASS